LSDSHLLAEIAVGWKKGNSAGKKLTCAP